MTKYIYAILHPVIQPPAILSLHAEDKCNLAVVNYRPLPVCCFTGEECLTLALKTRCQNQLKRRRSRSDRMVGRVRFRRSTLSRAARVERSSGLCEIHFLPLVVGVRDSNRTQRLRCVGESMTERDRFPHTGQECVFWP